MSSFYVKPFVKLLRSEDSRSDIAMANIEIIIPISYSVKRRGELARATLANLEKAIKLRGTICPNALIVFGCCSHPFPGAEDDEGRLKAEICRQKEVPFLDIGPIVNSITEMEGVKGVLASRGMFPKSILVVTCELHSKSERILGKMVFPDAKLFVSCNPHDLEVESDHLTEDQRSWSRWLYASVVRFVAFKAASWGIISLDTIRFRQHKQGTI
ncbi:hypothetical protein KW799_00720 [Candidatus Parcubacteria bacterium]|nr:hypothetical protein [Candidatus Parcubacteria bacterium]